MSESSNSDDDRARFRIRAPQDFAGGLSLIAISIFVLWAVSNLNLGTPQSMGPAMFPRGLAILLGLGGIFLVVQAFRRDGEPIGRLSIRGPIMVTAGIIAFALTIRSLGLAVAGMLALLVSGFATDEARLREALVFSVAISVLCIVLFRYLLGMAVPILIVPGTSIGF